MLSVIIKDCKKGCTTMINALSQHIGRDIARLIYFKYLDRVDRWFCLTASKLPNTFISKLLFRYRHMIFPKNLLSDIIIRHSNNSFNIIKWLLDHNYTENYHRVRYTINNLEITNIYKQVPEFLMQYEDDDLTTGYFYFSKNK